MFESFDHGVWCGARPGRQRTTLRSRRLFVPLHDEGVTSYHAATRTTLARFAQQTLALAAAGSGIRLPPDGQPYRSGRGDSHGSTFPSYDPENVNFSTRFGNGLAGSEGALGRGDGQDALGGRSWQRKNFATKLGTSAAATKRPPRREITPDLWCRMHSRQICHASPNQDRRSVGNGASSHDPETAVRWGAAKVYTRVRPSYSPACSFRNRTSSGFLGFTSKRSTISICAAR